MSTPDSPESTGAPGPFAFLSRRRWLKVALGAGGALLAGGGGLWYWIRGSAPHVEGLHVLADHEHRTLSALVEALFGARGEGGPIDVAALDLPRAFDDFLVGEPDKNVSDLHDAITFLEISPFLSEPRLATPFSRLAVEERRAVFRGLMTSEELLRRQVALAFRKFFNLVFYDREELWSHIHYPGPALGRRGSR